MGADAAAVPTVDVPAAADSQPKLSKPGSPRQSSSRPTEAPVEEATDDVSVLSDGESNSSPDAVTSGAEPATDEKSDEKSELRRPTRRKIVPRRPTFKRRSGSEQDDTSTQVSESGLKWVAIFGGIALVAAIFAVLAYFKPGADVANPAWVDTGTTSDVSGDAKAAIETLYTYKFETVDQDFDKARKVLNNSMREEFDRTAQTTKDAVIQTKTATAAEVTDIGVKLLSDERAELVASMNVSASNDGVAQGSAQGPLLVTMEKVDGKWLLAKIEDQ